MKNFWAGIILVGVLFAASSTQTLSFQGKLLDNAGIAVTGTKTMTYTWYTAQTGGSIIPNATWTINNVAVQNGVYSVEFDATNVSLSNNNDIWVEVTIGGETLSPRIHLTANSFAQQAVTANFAATANQLSNGIFVSSNGAVGIGTKNPVKSLDISGNIRITTGSLWSTAPEMGFYNDGNTALPIKVGSVMAGPSYGSANPGIGNIVVDTNGQSGVGAGTFGLYSGLGSLPGYPSDRYPTLRTSYGYLYFSAGGSYSAYMTSAGVLTAQSDRNKKTDFQEISRKEYFDRISKFKIYQWRYKDDPTKALHIGPFAQDMHAYFNTYEEKMLSPQDTAGTALLGVKHLVDTIQEQQKEIDEQKVIIKRLSERLDTLEKNQKH